MTGNNQRKQQNKDKNNQRVHRSPVGCHLENLLQAPGKPTRRQTREQRIADNNARKQAAERNQQATQGQNHFITMIERGEPGHCAAGYADYLPHLPYYTVGIVLRSLFLPPLAPEPPGQRPSHYRQSPKAPQSNGIFRQRPRGQYTLTTTPTYPHNRNMFPPPASRLRRVF